MYESENKINAIDDLFELDQEVIKKLLIDIFANAKAKDMDRLEACHLNSPKFSKLDDGDVLEMQDYAMAKKTEEKLFTAISDFYYILPNVKVDFFDDVAIATFILDYSVKMDEDTFAAKSRGTLVFDESLNIYNLKS